MESNLMFNLEGRVAIITGASRGIGEATARLLAKYGAHVVISSRRIEGCQAVADSINAEGGSAEAIACHIGEIDQIENLINETNKKYGRLDILINNAAANPYFGPILDTDLSAYQKTVDVNVRGYFFASVAAGKIMRDQGGGNIVNVASVNGITPQLWQGVYSISKAAIINMTEAFAKEVAEYKIRVNAIAPGLTDTRFAGAIANDENVINTIPLKRIAQPSEMASAILYLVSDASSYATGMVMRIDGGLLA